MKPARFFSVSFNVLILAVLFAGTTPLGAQTRLRELPARLNPVPEADDIPLKNWRATRSAVRPCNLTQIS